MAAGYRIFKVIDAETSPRSLDHLRCQSWHHQFAPGTGCRVVYQDCPFTRASGFEAGGSGSSFEGDVLVVADGMSSVGDKVWRALWERFLPAGHVAGGNPAVLKECRCGLSAVQHEAKKAYTASLDLRGSHHTSVVQYNHVAEGYTVLEVPVPQRTGKYVPPSSPLRVHRPRQTVGSSLRDFSVFHTPRGSVRFLLLLFKSGL